MELRCAECVWILNRRDIAKMAVTMYQGTALCLDHLKTVRESAPKSRTSTEWRAASV